MLVFLTLSVAEVVAPAHPDSVVVVVDFRGAQADRRVSAVGQLGAAVVEDVLEAEGELALPVHVLGCVEGEAIGEGRSGLTGRHRIYWLGYFVALS